MKWIDKLSWPVLLILVVFLGLAPISPEPHLWQKSRMLLDGTLTKPIDIFDLVLHGMPMLLLMVKLLRHGRSGHRP